MQRSIFSCIVGINLAVLVGLAVGLRLLNQGEEKNYDYMGQMFYLILFLLSANVGFALFSNQKQERQAHWLSCLLVLLIGFGLCAVGTRNAL